MKTTIKRQRKNTERVRRELLTTYCEKYFNLWLNAYKWEGINREQREYIMRKFWDVGSVASFPIIKAERSFLKGQKPSEQENGLIGFSTFAVQNYNMFNYPTAVRLNNERAVPYIPNKIMTNGVDVVLGYAQHSRQPIKLVINNYIERIVNVEMTIRTNLYAHKLPFVIKVGDKSLDKANYLRDSIVDDDIGFFVGVKDLDAIESIEATTPYIIDKLQAYKEKLENELLTFLGINNVNFEKKERLITDEVNSNNDLIGDYEDAILSNLKEFCDLTNRAFGFSMAVKSTNSEIAKQEEQDDNNDDNNGEDE